jgi:hypothetical protein
MFGLRYNVFSDSLDVVTFSLAFQEIPMTNDAFWKIVAQSKSASDGKMEAQIEAAQRELSQLPPEEIVEFQRIFDACVDQAYRWDLWGAAYILGGGCSDDAFTDFRSWLISMGRSVFESAMADPDSLADVEIGPDAEKDAFFEEFAYVASQVYEEVVGDEMPYPLRSQPSEPVGDPWEEESDELQVRFPRLWGKYGESD